MTKYSLLATVVLGFGSSVFAAEPPITAAAFTPDGKHVVLGSQSGIDVRSWPELKSVRTIKTTLVHVHDLAFSPDGKQLLAAGGAPAEEGAVEVWTWPEGKQVRRVAEHKDVVYRVAWSPDGKLWVSVGGDGICHVHAADTGKKLTRYEGHSRAGLAVVFLADSKTVISAGVDQSLQVWDATTGNPTRALDNHTKAVNDLAVRPNADPDALPVVASAGEDGTVRLWQPTIGRLMRFKRFDAAPRSIAWTPDGKQLLVGCTDGSFVILDPDTLKVDQQLNALDGRVYTVTPHPETTGTALVGGAGIQGVKW